MYSIATVVNDLIERIMIDPRLNANPKVDEAHHRVPPAGFEYLVTEMVCRPPARLCRKTSVSSHGDHYRQSVRLLRRKAEHLVLPGPFRRQVGEASNPHTMGEPAIDGRLDEIRGKES